MLLQRATQLWASRWGSFITGHFLGHWQGSQDGREPSLKGKSGTSNEAHGETNSSYELPTKYVTWRRKFPWPSAQILTNGVNLMGGHQREL